VVGLVVRAGVRVVFNPMSETLPYVIFLVAVVVRWGLVFLQEMGSLKPIDETTKSLYWIALATSGAIFLIASLS